jgi:prepilin-type N-terminal cleavage/methylation domain-containing protein
MEEGESTESRASAAGFTLIELMVTVAIIGVLALLATVGYARWARSAKTAEATSMISAIKGAQETYRAEALRYLNVSGGDLGKHFPTSDPSDKKVAWDVSACTDDVCKGFRVLGVHADSQVYYRYSTIAGAADGATRTIDGRSYPAANDPWFVVKAQGDLDANGKRSSYWSSSFDNTVTSKDPDE